MGSKLLDLPMKLLMPSSFDNPREVAFKTIPSASKGDIKMVLQTMYGFEIEKVRTLNMQGKKKRRGSRLVARPNYKKAYITLKTPLPISSELHPAHAIENERNARSSFFLEDDVKYQKLYHKKAPKPMLEQFASLSHEAKKQIHVVAEEN